MLVNIPTLHKKRFGEKERFMFFLMAPAAILLFLFQVLPIGMGLNVSFRDWMLNDPKKTWIGLDHYLSVLGDPVFVGKVIPNTFLFMFGSVSISLCLGLGIALMLNRGLKGQKFIQTVLLLPLMIAPVIAAIMMRWIFNDQFGIVNIVLEALGMEPPAWLARQSTAFLVILMTDIWLWTPWFCILILAALQSFPKEPFEAAEIDAASRWRVFRYLTIPMLRPVIVVCVVIRMIDAFRTFDIVWTLTGGGPARSTELFSLYAYNNAFQNLNFGRGSAAAIIGAVVIVLVGAVLFKVMTRLTTQSIGNGP